jgi:hypothetical protein
MTLTQTLKFIIEVQESGRIAEGLQLLRSLNDAIIDGKTTNFFPEWANDKAGLIKQVGMQVDNNLR